ncbi:class D sortase [Fictibacillus barbaricus]|uniref:Sortase A n=1 Tax=Fictibacillus barbaricus TaxID=182136 RepID=A0ABU1U1T4_9BACL|nr:class D sortase [Fictibacillus barbaricus]MDR7073336.1 sortase A [Fictibacillus barbaricus]
MKRFAYLLIVIGLIMMMYPKAKSMYYSYQEQKMLSEWEASVDPVVKQSFQQLDDVFLEESSPEPNKTLNKGVIGKLSIQKIGLVIPIVEGASLKNMKTAAGHLRGTAPIGEIGNAAIAAHRSYTYGKQFNRLMEVKKGDLIQITTSKKVLTYSITEEKLVKPSNLSILHDDKKESKITLITCHPMKNPTHRFIVKAVLKKEEVL